VSVFVINESVISVCTLVDEVQDFVIEKTISDTIPTKTKKTLTPILNAKL
jgi:hypothetical protein